MREIQKWIHENHWVALIPLIPLALMILNVSTGGHLLDKVIKMTKADEGEFVGILICVIVVGVLAALIIWAI